MSSLEACLVRLLHTSQWLQQELSAFRTENTQLRHNLWGLSHCIEDLGHQNCQLGELVSILDFNNQQLQILQLQNLLLCHSLSTVVLELQGLDIEIQPQTSLDGDAHHEPQVKNPMCSLSNAQPVLPETLIVNIDPIPECAACGDIYHYDKRLSHPLPSKYRLCTFCDGTNPHKKRGMIRSEPKDK